MRSLHISGEKLLLGFDFLAYITQFRHDWRPSAPSGSRPGTLEYNAGFDGWLPPNETASIFTTDPVRLRDVLSRAIEIPQAFDEDHVDIYGIEEYFEVCLSDAHAFLRCNQEAFRHVVFDAYPLLLITVGDSVVDSESLDPQTQKLENPSHAYICRFLHALAVGKVQESDLH